MPSMNINLDFIEQILLKLHQINVMYPQYTSENFKNALTHDSLQVQALGGISLTFNQSQNQNVPQLDECLLTDMDVINIYELHTFRELKDLSPEDKAFLLRSLISTKLIMLIQVFLAICIQDISKKDLIAAVKFAKKRNIVLSLMRFIEPDDLEIPPSDNEKESFENTSGDEHHAFSKDSSSEDSVEIDAAQNQFCCYRLYQKLKMNFKYYFPSLSNDAQITVKPKQR